MLNLHTSTPELGTAAAIPVSLLASKMKTAENEDGQWIEVFGKRFSNNFCSVLVACLMALVLPRFKMVVKDTIYKLVNNKAPSQVDIKA
jgi:hypothetical protein